MKKGSIVTERIILAKDSIGKASENFERVIKLDIRTIEFLEANLKEITDSFVEEIKKTNR